MVIYVVSPRLVSSCLRRLTLDCGRDLLQSASFTSYDRFEDIQNGVTGLYQ
jgi:hypothetical protein